MALNGYHICFDVSEVAEGKLCEWSKSLTEETRSKEMIDMMLIGRAMKRISSPLVDLIVGFERRDEQLSIKQVEVYITMFRAHHEILEKTAMKALGFLMKKFHF